MPKITFGRVVSTLLLGTTLLAAGCGSGRFQPESNTRRVLYCLNDYGYPGDRIETNCTTIDRASFQAACESPSLVQDVAEYNRHSNPAEPHINQSYVENACRWLGFTPGGQGR